MVVDPGFTMTIGGRAVEGDRTFPVVNPATGEPFADAPGCSAAQLDAAVAAARDAFPGWAATALDDRRRALTDLADAVTAATDDLSALLTREQGKPHADARIEVLGTAAWLRASAQLDLPETVNEDSADRRSVTRRVPLGVVAAIAPWNAPLIVAAAKIMPALLAGNTVVLKPSPLTPLTTLKLGELARTALPPGVLNVVAGGDELGPWITAHPGINKVSFTGSTVTGRRVMAGAAADLKRITLELGGNDAAIVLPDVDVGKVAERLFWAAFGNSGQVCVAAKRMYVHKDVYEPLRDAIVAYAATVPMGDGAQQGVRLGPIQNEQQYRRVAELIADARETGCRILTGAEPPAGPGYFIPVTIVDNPPEDSRIVQEEQFGPVLPLIRIDSVEEGIRRANASDYGLGGSVWSGDEEAALEVALRLETGNVWINEARRLSPTVPFAGHKQSGFGVESGQAGLLEHTASRTIEIRRGADVS